MKKLAGVATFVLVLAACTSVSSQDPLATADRPLVEEAAQIAVATTTTSAITTRTEEPKLAPAETPLAGVTPTATSSVAPTPAESSVLVAPQAAIGQAITPSGITIPVPGSASSVDQEFTVTWNAPPPDKSEVELNEWFARVAPSINPCLYTGSTDATTTLTLDLPTNESERTYDIYACGTTLTSPNPGPWSTSVQVVVMRTSP